MLPLYLSTETRYTANCKRFMPIRLPQMRQNIYLSFIKEYVKKFETELKQDDNYRIERFIEELCETMLIISILLNESDEAVKYYWEHAHDSNKEITLYKILDTIREFGDKKLWIRVYEDGLKKTYNQERH